MPQKYGSLLQEKFQTTSSDPQEDGTDRWATFASARSVNGEHRNEDVAIFNYLPPGMDISNQPHKRIESMPLSIAGATDVTNVVSVPTIRRGWLRKDMSPVDDMYTNEHVEEFYGEARGTDDSGEQYTGFLERNNLLDRT
jgi:hypothetical protein